MKLLLVLCLCGLAFARPDYQSQVEKQASILQLLDRVQQPIIDEKVKEIGHSYKPVLYYNNYKQLSRQHIEKFVEKVHRQQTLPRQKIFNLFNDKQRQEAIALFELLYYAQDFETFYKTAAWARVRVNEGQFVYAVSVAVLHRQDTRGVVLPPLHKIYPSFFVNKHVIREVYKAKINMTPTVIPMAITTSQVRHPDQRVAYFTDDISLNTHVAHWNYLHAFWFKQTYNVMKDRQGEKFFQMHHNLLTRYELERLSNDLPPVSKIHLYKPIKSGFAPHATYANGLDFPSRPEHMQLQSVGNLTLETVDEWYRRVVDAVDAGYVLTKEQQKKELDHTTGINVLGKMLQGGQQTSPNPRYYGHLQRAGHVLIGKVTDPKNKYEQAPAVVEQIETSARDPAMYGYWKVIDQIFLRYKNTLPPYTRSQLVNSGVQVEAIKVIGESRASTPNTLITHMEHVDIDVSNAVVMSEQQATIDVKARVQRLTHEPFKYVITVKSREQKKAVVRIFLAPKYNWLGEKLAIDQQRWMAVEMDKFVTELNQGTTIIKRASHQSAVTVTGTKEQLQTVYDVESVLKRQQQPLYVNKQVHQQCGYPQHLLLPKGKPQGMSYKLYVVVTDHEQDYVPSETAQETEQYYGYCGHAEVKYPDNKPLGYPFDRRIVDEDQFVTPNMQAVDVVIKHVRPVAY
uniref:Hexamerin 3 n=1 Tax=Octostigma sinensis TaxID=211997 RepID=A0A4D6GKQ3_9HEXA|nr:hexamerin 3 precursor [Octostigma sinensis]